MSNPYNMQDSTTPPRGRSISPRYEPRYEQAHAQYDARPGESDHRYSYYRSRSPSPPTSARARYGDDTHRQQAPAPPPSNHREATGSVQQLHPTKETMIVLAAIAPRLALPPGARAVRIFIEYEIGPSRHRGRRGQ